MSHYPPNQYGGGYGQPDQGYYPPQQGPGGYYPPEVSSTAKRRIFTDRAMRWINTFLAEALRKT